MRIVDKKKLTIFLSILLLIVFLPIVGYLFIYRQITEPISSQPEEINLVIGKGQGLREIADSLEKTGLVRNDFWFVAYVFYKGWAGQLQAGEYSLSPTLSIPEIARKITGGEVLPGEVSVTIPEGFTLKKIDARLASLGLIKPGELLVRTELEGYLFPDTYRFKKEAGLEEIISKMRQNFEQKVDGGLRTEIVRQGKTLADIIIMASLIEKEVAADYDRKIVSGIFWERLADNYPLESCATIAYILGVDKWRYSNQDTKIDSPYNTYRNIGLPPGPIANPGLSAIRAAVYPQASEYYFFLSDPSGQTIFSKTLEKHNENKAKYLR